MTNIKPQHYEVELETLTELGGHHGVPVFPVGSKGFGCRTGFNSYIVLRDERGGTWHCECYEHDLKRA